MMASDVDINHRCQFNTWQCLIDMGVHFTHESEAYDCEFHVDHPFRLKECADLILHVLLELRDEAQDVCLGRELVVFD